MLRWFLRRNRPLHLVVSILILANLLLTNFPLTPVYASANATTQTSADTTNPPVPETRTAETPTDPHLPSLNLKATLDSQNVTMGDTVVLNLIVTNDAPDPANTLVVTLPVPEGATALPKDNAFTPGTGWAWTLPVLAPNSTTSFTTSLTITSVPAGEALLLFPQVTATGLKLPVTLTTGAVVSAAPATPNSLSTNAISPEANPTTSTPDSSAFTPGKETILKSANDRIEVKFPKDGYKESLALSYTGKKDKTAALKAKGATIPPEKAGSFGNFETFFLDAVDQKGQTIHKFDAPLTISYHYTPQQLRALGITEQSLTLSYFDETKVTDLGGGKQKTGEWVKIPTDIDLNTHTASAQVDHFTGFQLSDGSAPSTSFIPSLQGWQESAYTGSVSYSYPIEIPAGPAGIKPNLNMSYSSAATDGKGGYRNTNQAGWTGKGWSFDTGSVGVNKINGTDGLYLSLVFNGQSFDLVRAEDLNSSLDARDLTRWNWRPSSEAYIKARAVNGGTNGGVKWQVWSKDGTLYEFSMDLWWNIVTSCYSPPTPDFAQREQYRWMLTKVTDTHGNTINYNYDSSNRYNSVCYGVAGQVWDDVWPTSVTWGGNTGTGAIDRYKATFDSSARTYDTQYEGYTKQTRQLNTIKVWSNPAGTWQLVSQYNLCYAQTSISGCSAYASSSVTYSDNLVGNGVDTTAPKLTLKSIQKVGNDGTTALPPTVFTYGTRNYPNPPNGGWNRITGINNGQGGSISYTYDQASSQVSDPGSKGYFDNYHRVISKTTYDRGTAVGTWTYSYTQPLLNSRGTTLGGRGPLANPTSAALYEIWHEYGDDETMLVHPAMSEFRGHQKTVVTDPAGTQTEHYFYQGDDPCGVPNGYYGINDTCFIKIRNNDFLKGKEWKTRIIEPGSVLYSEVVHTFTVNFLDYTWLLKAGIWRGFAYESQTDSKIYEGNGTPLTKTTKYYYDAANQYGGVFYGNLSKTEDYDQSGALYRTTATYYNTRNDAATYLVDKPISQLVFDGQNRQISQTQYGYDGLGLFQLGTKGELTLSRKIYDLPLVTSPVDVDLHTQDTSLGYDAYGNPTTNTTYTSPGVLRNNSSTGAWVWSSAGNGSTAITTTTSFDSTFHALPIQSTPPTVNGVTLTETASYDYRMGTLTGVTDANSNTTNAEYDVFGRMVKLIKPGDSSASPTTQAYYADWEQPFRYQILQKEVVGATGYGKPTEKIYDGLGRLIQTKSESVDVAQMVVTDTVYDSLSRPIKQSQPRYVNESGVGGTGPFWYYTTPSTDPNVMRWTVTAYDGVGRTASVTLPDNTVSKSFNYVVQDGTKFAHVVNSIDPNHHLKQNFTDEFGHQYKVQEYTGNCYAQPYDIYQCGGSYTSVWTLYATTNSQFSPLGQLKQVTDNANNITSINYDTLGRKLSMTDPDMGNWNYQYDVNGNLTQQTDAKNQTISFNYDLLNRVTTKTALGGPVTFADTFNTAGSGNWAYGSQQTVPYNDNGNNVLQNNSGTTDWSGVLVRNSFSLSTGKSLSVRFKIDQQAANTTASYLIDSNSSPRRTFGVVAYGGNIYAQYNLDGTNYITTTNLIPGFQVNAWYTLQISLDDTNSFTARVQQESDLTKQGSYSYPMPSGLTWRFWQGQQQGSTYLDEYREYSNTNPQYAVSTYKYDEATSSNGKGKRTSISNANATTSWQFDTRGRTTQAQYGISGMSGTRTFNWTYDSADRVSTIKYPSLTNPSNTNASDRETLTYSYDAAWRQTQVCSNASGTPCYASGTQYNALSQPTTETLGNGLKQTWNYTSPLSRLSQMQVGTTATPGSLFDRSYSYDNIGNVLTLTNNVSWQTQTQNFTYDSLDRLGHAYTTGGTGGSTNVKINFQTSTTTTPSGYLADTGLAYGDRGNGYSYGWSVDNTINSRERNATNSPDKRFDTLNHMQKAPNTNASWEIAVPNGTYTVRVVVGDPSNIDSVYKVNVENTLAVDYTPTTANPWVDRTVVVQVTDGKLTVSNAVGAVNNRINFIEISGGVQGYDETDQYDTIGNITSKAGVVYQYPAAGQPRPHTPTAVGGVNYSYDGNGNLTSGGNRSYTWNVDNQPLTITTLLDNVTEAYGYDANSARVFKGRSGTTTYYAGGLWEEDSTGAKKIYFQFGGKVIALREQNGANNTLTYLHGDHLGSVSLATNSTGGVVSQQEFDPWGKVRLGAVPQTSMNYTGQRLDGTGLLFYNARYYDPGLGKFLSPDTVSDGLNRYSYVHNNPLNSTDPTGHREIESDGGGGSSEEDSRNSDDGKSIEERDWQENPYTADSNDGNPGYNLNEDRQSHILDGDYEQNEDGDYVPVQDPETGEYSGGHGQGRGFPGKSEFPEGWDDDKATTAIIDIANDPDIPESIPNDEGRIQKTGERDGLFITVVINPHDGQPGSGEIWTGWPHTPPNPLPQNMNLEVTPKLPSMQTTLPNYTVPSSQNTPKIFTTPFDFGNPYYF